MQDLKDELLEKEIDLALSNDELSHWGDILKTEGQIIAKILKIHCRYCERQFSSGTFFRNACRAVWMALVIAFFLPALTPVIGGIPALLIGACACAFIVKVMQSTDYMLINFLINRKLKEKRGKER